MKHAISSTNDGQSEHMSRQIQIFSVIFLLFSVPLSGCIEASEDGETNPQGETLVEIQNPCIMPTESQTQVMISIYVDDVERVFRLSVPNSEAGTKLPLIIAYHGGDGAGEDFQQQNQFDQL